MLRSTAGRLLQRTCQCVVKLDLRTLTLQLRRFDVGKRPLSLPESKPRPPLFDYFCVIEAGWLCIVFFFPHRRSERRNDADYGRAAPVRPERVRRRTQTASLRASVRPRRAAAEDTAWFLLRSPASSFERLRPQGELHQRFHGHPDWEVARVPWRICRCVFRKITGQSSMNCHSGILFPQSVILDLHYGKEDCQLFLMHLSRDKIEGRFAFQLCVFLRVGLKARSKSLLVFCPSVEFWYGTLSGTGNFWNNGTQKRPLQKNTQTRYHADYERVEPKSRMNHDEISHD